MHEFIRRSLDCLWELVELFVHVVLRESLLPDHHDIMKNAKGKSEENAKRNTLLEKTIWFLFRSGNGEYPVPII